MVTRGVASASVDQSDCIKNNRVFCAATIKGVFDALPEVLRIPTWLLFV